MGGSNNVDFDCYPVQGDLLGKAVRVCFSHDASRAIEGIVIRDDVGGDNRTIIQLADGRVVLGTECQYQPACQPSDSQLVRVMREGRKNGRQFCGPVGFAQFAAAASVATTKPVGG